MRILIVIEYYVPGYRGGGSIRTIANLVEALGDEFEFTILTSDRDWRSVTPFEGITPDEWVRVGKARVRYLSPRGWRFRRLADVLGSEPYDVLYLNSLFSPAATIRPLLLRRFGAVRNTPVILGPRGELARGALATRTLKKRAWLRTARLLGLFRGVTWQASTPAEAADIRREFGANVPLVEAVDCARVVSTEEHQRPPKTAGKARLSFVARIAPVKNLEFAIRLLERIEGQIAFDLYGPIETPEYWKRCEALLATLPPNVRATYHGAVTNEEVPRILASCDLLLLPTLGENFGHAILEALGAGCPVLLSDQTPWRGLASARAGWDLPLEDVERFCAAVREIVAMDEPQHREMRRGAREFARRAGQFHRAVEENRAMFLAAGGRRPG